jgi:hypothetical protein
MGQDSISRLSQIVNMPGVKQIQTKKVREDVLSRAVVVARDATNLKVSTRN